MKFILTPLLLLSVSFANASNEINLRCNFEADSTGYKALNEIVVNKATNKVSVTEINSNDHSDSFTYTLDANFTADKISFKKVTRYSFGTGSATTQIDRRDLSILKESSFNSKPPSMYKGQCEIFEVANRKI